MCHASARVLVDLLDQYSLLLTWNTGHYLANTGEHSPNSHCYSHEIDRCSQFWQARTRTQAWSLDPNGRKSCFSNTLPPNDDVFDFEYAPPLAFLQCRGVQNPSTLERGSAEYWEGGIGHGTFQKQANFGKFKSKSLRCIFSTQYENKFCNKEHVCLWWCKNIPWFLLWWEWQMHSNTKRKT